MINVRTLINYWIFIIAVLVFSRMMQVNLTTAMVVKLVAVATVLYAATVAVWKIFKRKGQIARGENPDGKKV